MVLPRLSSKIEAFKARVEQETGRSVLFIEEPNMLQGMLADTIPDPVHIVVRFDPRRIRSAMSVDIENSIAHELTHNLLELRKEDRFVHPLPERPFTQMEKMYVSLLFNAIDDIVVNKFVADEGFPAYASNYIEMTKKELNAANNRKDLYIMYADDLLFKNRFMAYRYLLAWSYVTYHDLPPPKQRCLTKFLTAFENAFPQQYGIAKQIIDIILQHDVFTPEGHREIIRQILPLWQLDNVVTLSTE